MFLGIASVHVFGILFEFNTRNDNNQQTSLEKGTYLKQNFLGPGLLCWTQ